MGRRPQRPRDQLHDVVTLYERIDRFGNGEDCYLALNDGAAELEPGQKIAFAAYTITDNVGLAVGHGSAEV